ncbi:MAG: hypothetical protein M1831_000673 [Alyxoria varia]|nr:MAG: hypothetical protein M1831_000673 [Alyxoria varia]
MRERNIQLPENLEDLLLQHSIVKESLVQVEYLLGIGADPDALIWSYKELDELRQENEHEISRKEVEDLKFFFHCENSLSYAINCESVEVLIEGGADVNAHDGRFVNPLCAALGIALVLDKVPSKILLKLLQRGAKPDEPTHVSGVNCRKVLHKAIKTENFEAVDLLLDYGADIHVACERHGAAIMQAVRMENSDMIKLLLGRGARLNDLDACGQTLVQRAVEERLFIAVEILSSFDAPTTASATSIQAHVEASAKTLITELSFLPDEFDQELRLRKWITLGRCLWFGNDVENALIALEQSTFHRMECFMCSPFGPPCFTSDRAVRHLCKRGSATPICRDHCLENHLDELQQLGRLDEHESIEFPRSIFYETSEGQVVLNNGTYLPRDEWLKSLSGWTWGHAPAEVTSG